MKAVNVSARKREKKSPVASVRLLEGHGIEGDAHGGTSGHRQVSLLSEESVSRMRAKGIDVGAGDFAENLTVEGIDLAEARVGRRIRVGEALLEVTQVGKECHDRCAIYLQVGDCVMPREGIFAKVLHGGEIKQGDRITIVEEDAMEDADRKRRPRGKYKSPHKPNVISMRISDDEMKVVKELMDFTNKGASELMRDAFRLFMEQATPASRVTAV